MQWMHSVSTHAVRDLRESFSCGLSSAMNTAQVTGNEKNSTSVKKPNSIDGTGIFFYGLLFLWFASVIVKFIEYSTEMWPVIAGFIFFEIVNKGLEVLIGGKPDFLSGLPEKSVPLFLNTSVSLVHSTIVSCSVVGILAKEGHKTGIESMWQHETLFSGTWPGTSLLLGISCGYFAYDQWDMLRRRLYRPNSPSLLIHHAVLLTCFTAALYRDVCRNYMILTLVCELHSIFLHFRKVVILAGAKRRWNSGTKLQWGLNWFTFFTTRLGMHVLIFWKVLMDATKFPRGVELPLAIMGMLGLNVLNVLLGEGLYKAFRRESLGISNAAKASED